MAGEQVDVMEPGSDLVEKEEIHEVPQLGPGGKKFLVCAACRAKITHQKERISVNGSHEHTFFNPHGHLFHIGCFGAAPGCMTGGTPSEEFSWFPSYKWQIAVCGNCQAHLGWQFIGGDRTFYGLILNHLTELEEDDE